MAGTFLAQDRRFFYCHLSRGGLVALQTLRWMMRDSSAPNFSIVWRTFTLAYYHNKFITYTERTCPSLIRHYHIPQ
eukprot:COSAG05_NODE_1559_length_4564_cov_2.602240_7_plen_76_part_00